MPAPTRGLLTYLAVAFGLAWAIELGPVRMVGYQQGSVGTMLWLVLVMFTPTIAAIVARRVEGGGYGDAGPRWGRGRVHLAAWLVPPAVGIASTVLVLALGLGRFDLSMSAMVDKLPPEGRQLVADQVKHFGPLLPVLVMVQALFGAVLVNTIPCFGEEFGWRGYLQMRLERFGMVRSALLTGLIWGVWHVPIVAQGHNYPGEPVWGSLLFIVFCGVWGVILGWLRNASGSVLAPTIAHASINGPAVATMMFVSGSHVLVGGLIGVVGIALAVLFAAWLSVTGRLDRRLDAPQATPVEAPTESPSGDAT